MIRLCLLLICLVPLSVSARERVLYCVDELGAGFKANDDGTYRVANFKPERFTIKLGEMWETFSVDDEVFDCHDWGNFKNKEHEGAYHILMVCKNQDLSSSETFNFEVISMRYTRTLVSVHGFANPSAKNDDVMFAGTCEEF